MQVVFVGDINATATTDVSTQEFPEARSTHAADVCRHNFVGKLQLACGCTCMNMAV